MTHWLFCRNSANQPHRIVLWPAWQLPAHKKMNRKKQQQLASKINKAIFTNRNRSVCISVHLSIGGRFFAIPNVYIYVRVFFMMSLGYIARILVKFSSVLLFASTVIYVHCLQLCFPANVRHDTS